MKKEVAFYNTKDPKPSFVILQGIEINVDDYVGSYDDLMLCRGSKKLDSSTLIIPAHADTWDNTKKQGFELGESIKMFYYNSLEDKAYQLLGDYFRYETMTKVSEMEYAPLSLYLMLNPMLGSEITLNIDEELTEEVLSINPIPNLKVGDPKLIEIDFTAQNIENLQFNVMQGTGKVYKQRHFPMKWVYEASVDDVEVSIQASGTGVFSDELITSLVSFNVEKEQSEGIYSNDHFSLIESDGQLVLKSNFAKVAVLIRGRFNMAFNMMTDTERVWMPMVRFNSWLVVDGTVSGTYKIFDNQTKRWSSDIPFSFNV